MRWLRPWLLFFCASLLGAASLRVVVDTDAGSDDLLAIAFLLTRPDVHIDAINVVHGMAHVQRGAENIRKLLAAAGRDGIPVNVGRDEPMKKTAEFPASWRQTADELLASLPTPNNAAPTSDAATYYRSTNFADKKVLALGPLTNLAMAIRTGVQFSEIVMMGGAIRVPGNLGDGGYFHTTNKTAEWNLFCDPQAAAIVFESGAAIRMVPLDATNQVPIYPRFVDDLRAIARTPLADVVARLLENDREVIAHGIYYAWDPLAAVALVEPNLVRWEKLRVRIRADGASQEVATGGHAIDAALHADAPRFREKFLSGFGGSHKP